VAMISTFLRHSCSRDSPLPSQHAGPIQIVTYIVPARYFVAIVKGIFLRGVWASHALAETAVSRRFSRWLRGAVDPDDPQKSADHCGSAFYVLRKEFRSVLRDPRMRMVIFGLPVIQTLIFGYAVSLDVRHVRLGVLDRDQTTASRALVARFTGSAYFDAVAFTQDEAEARRLLDATDAAPSSRSTRIRSRSAGGRTPSSN